MREPINRLRGRAIAIMCFAATAVAAPAGPLEDPQQLVDATIEQLRAEVTRDSQLIDADPVYAMDLVESAIAPHIDVRLTSRLVLGRHWRDAKPAQRDRFVDGLRRLLLRLIATHINDYRDALVAYSPTVFKGEHNKRATVRTQVSKAGTPPVSVDYRLYLTKAGWKVYDVAIYGISVVKTYHLTLDADIRKLGLDGVIDEINAKFPLPEAAGQQTERRASAG